MIGPDGGSSSDEVVDPFNDALLAARMCAIYPGLGGIVLRGGGEMRDAIIAELRRRMPADAPVRRIPISIDDERLLGGLDLTATLARGETVSQRGMLAEADGGVIVLPMAERMGADTAGRIVAAVDRGDTRFLTIALDDGLEPEERPPTAVMERLAFWIDLSSIREPPDHSALDALIAPGGEPAEASPEILSSLVGIAAALGIDSARPALFALRAARALAMIDHRTEVEMEDVILAARLVLASRATRIPQSTADDAPTDSAPTPPVNDEGEDDRGEPAQVDDMVLEAVMAHLPKDVLARIASGNRRRAPQIRTQGAGDRRKSTTRGRPKSALAGLPRGGLRLSLIDTLRAAAPWQRLRGRADGRVHIRRSDLRIRRFETRAQALTIFAVDASGSSALTRLAEAKGAVELLLAESYVQRAQVALVAFRGTAAELLLPPTRSLARARRALGELPGGGGTPLAAGLNAARDLAELGRAKGLTPFIVVLTDGRANIAGDGSAILRLAQADAEAAAKAIGMSGIASAFVDISARPRPEGASLAASMGARYLPLPRADSATMHAAVSGARPA